MSYFTSHKSLIFCEYHTQKKKHMLNKTHNHYNSGIRVLTFIERSLFLLDTGQCAVVPYSGGEMRHTSAPFTVYNNCSSCL